MMDRVLKPPRPLFGFERIFGYFDHVTGVIALANGDERSRDHSHYFLSGETTSSACRQMQLKLGILPIARVAFSANPCSFF